jgi:hypothetical protein
MEKGLKRMGRIGWIQMQCDFPPIEMQKNPANARLMSGRTTGNAIPLAPKAR